MIHSNCLPMQCIICYFFISGSWFLNNYVYLQEEIINKIELTKTILFWNDYRVLANKWFWVYYIKKNGIWTKKKVKQNL